MIIRSDYNTFLTIITPEGTEHDRQLYPREEILSQLQTMKHWGHVSNCIFYLDGRIDIHLQGKGMTTFGTWYPRPIILINDPKSPALSHAAN